MLHYGSPEPPPRRHRAQPRIAAPPHSSGYKELLSFWRQSLITAPCHRGGHNNNEQHLSSTCLWRASQQPCGPTTRASRIALQRGTSTAAWSTRTCKG